MKKYDPRLIVCPHCRAPVGAWCQISHHKKLTDPIVGFVHTHRSQAAARFRRAGDAPRNQLRLFKT